MATFVIPWEMLKCSSFPSPDITNADSMFTHRNVLHYSTFHLGMLHLERWEKMTQPCSQRSPQIHATSSWALSLQSFSLPLVSPCSRDWLTVLQTCFPFLLRNISRLYVSTSPAGRCGRVTGFWPTEYEWKWSKSLPGLYHATLPCSILTLLPHSAAEWRGYQSSKRGQRQKMERTWGPESSYGREPLRIVNRPRSTMVWEKETFIVLSHWKLWAVGCSS